MDNDDFQNFLKQFELRCRKCGSDQVVVDFEEGFNYSEHTYQPGHFTAGCNACKQNDFLAYQ